MARLGGILAGTLTALLAAAPGSAGAAGGRASVTAGGRASTVTAGAGITSATLSASFHPYRLGRRTTLQFGFAFTTASGPIPPPLTQVELRYPADIGVYTSEMGLASCQPGALEAGGPRACPADSVMGYGVVQTGVMLGQTPVHESSVVTVFRAPFHGRHFSLLFFAEGREPVLTDVIFPGQLLSASEPFGGLVSIGVPLVETLPGAPYVSVLRMHATIGPEKVTYFKRAGGITFAFKPRGIRLPPRCPRAGFPFAASFTFSDGSHALARTTVRCTDAPRRPASRTRAHRPRGAAR